MPNSLKSLLPCHAKKTARHGHTRCKVYSPTYSSWQSMLMRCRYPDRDVTDKYINRGISVCDRWLDFNNFLADMGERPAGTTIDRKDNSKGYSPENCQWSTTISQARNRRNARLNYEQALDIAVRMLAGESPKALSVEYGISESLPREIHRGRTWRDAHAAARA